MDDKMREAFERQAISRGNFTGRYDQPIFDEDEYQDWKRAWQAALAAQPRVTVDEVAEIIGNYCTHNSPLHGKLRRVHATCSDHKNGIAQALRSAFPQMIRG